MKMSFPSEGWLNEKFFSEEWFSECESGGEEQF